jgi:hypothetical protein
LDVDITILENDYEVNLEVNQEDVLIDVIENDLPVNLLITEVIEEINIEIETIQENFIVNITEESPPEITVIEQPEIVEINIQEGGASNSDGDVWADGSITRVNGYIQTVVKGNKTYTITRENNLIKEVDNGDKVITFTRENGLIQSWTVN